MAKKEACHLLPLLPSAVCLRLHDKVELIRVLPDKWRKKRQAWHLLPLLPATVGLPHYDKVGLIRVLPEKWRKKKKLGIFFHCSQLQWAFHTMTRLDRLGSCHHRTGKRNAFCGTKSWRLSPVISVGLHYLFTILISLVVVTSFTFGLWIHSKFAKIDSL